MASETAPVCDMVLVAVLYSADELNEVVAGLIFVQAEPTTLMLCLTALGHVVHHVATCYACAHRQVLKEKKAVPGSGKATKRAVHVAGWQRASGHAITPYRGRRNPSTG